MAIEFSGSEPPYPSRFDRRDDRGYRLPGRQEEYPLDAMPPLIRGAIEDVWDELRASHELIATAALGVVAVVCQGFVNVKRRPTFPPSPCSLFLIAVVGVSEAKTEVLKRFLPPIETFERAEKRRAKEGGAPARTVVYGKGSFAGFRRGLMESCRAAGILSPEAGGILNDPLITRHMPTWNSLWSGEDLMETFAKVEYFVEAPRWTASLMLQPDQFVKFRTSKHGKEALGNGFLARALVAYSRSTSSPKIDPDYIPSTARLEQFHQRVTAILEQPFPEPMNCVILRFSGDAYRYWTSYFNTLSECVNNGIFAGDMVGFVRKLPEQAARIAALFHYFSEYPICAPESNRESNEAGSSSLAENPASSKQEISERTVRSAIRLCDWYMSEHADKLLLVETPREAGPRSYDQKIDGYGRRLYGWVQKNYPALSYQQQSSCVKIEYTKFQNAHRSIGRPEELRAAMDLLGMQYGFRVNFPGEGRGKFICHEPNGNFCGRCSQLNSQVVSPSFANRFPNAHGMQNGDNVRAPIPLRPAWEATPMQQPGPAGEDSQRGSAVRTDFQFPFADGSYLAD